MESDTAKQNGNKELPSNDLTAGDILRDEDQSVSSLCQSIERIIGNNVKRGMVGMLLLWPE